MTGRVVAGWWSVFFVGLALQACGPTGVPPVPPESPFAGGSLPAHDAALRHYMTIGDSSALGPLLESGPRDALLRQLHAGLFLHRLGRYAESNAALQEADRLAEERYTKSISQNVGAFLLSDNVLDYYPSALEWSMIHYYGMLNYLQLGGVDEALVEARRANGLLRRYGNDNPGRTFTNPAAVQYVAGMLQWAAGEDNDAMVSLRQSLAAFEEYETRYGIAPPRPVVEDVVRVAMNLGFPEVADRTRSAYLAEDAALEPPSAESGELVVLVENGFIGHRAPQKLYIPVLKEEKDSVLSGDAGSALVAAAKVLVRTLIVMNELSRQGVEYPRHEDGVIVATAGSAVGLELITLAWPTYRLEARRSADVRVSVNDERSVTPALLQDLSAIAVRDFEETKPTILLRMVARGLLKEAAVTAAESAGEDAAGAVGGFLGRVATRAVTSATERADTRSWSTLPAELLVARFHLPPGRHLLRISYEGLHNRGEVLEFDVEIVAGAVTTHTVALLGDDQGDQARFRAAAKGVHYSAPAIPEVTEEPRDAKREGSCKPCAVSRKR